MTARDGREDLFDSMYRRYYPRVLRYFRRGFHASQEDAEEMTQEVFVRFFRTLDEYRGDAEWALFEKIALSVGCNRARSLKTIKRGAVKPDSLDDDAHPDNQPHAQQEHPLDQMIQKEQSTRIREEINGLPKGQQQCVNLWLEDLAYQQIAEVLQISLDAVKSRMRDARRQLLKRLGDVSALPEDES